MTRRRRQPARRSSAWTKLREIANERAELVRRPSGFASRTVVAPGRVYFAPKVATVQTRFVFIPADADDGDARGPVFAAREINSVVVRSIPPPQIFASEPVIFRSKPGHFARSRIHVRVTTDDERAVFSANFVRAPSRRVAFIRHLHLLHRHVPHANLPSRVGIFQAVFQVPIMILVDLVTFPGSFHANRRKNEQNSLVFATHVHSVLAFTLCASRHAVVLEELLVPFASAPKVPHAVPPVCIVVSFCCYVLNFITHGFF